MPALLPLLIALALLTQFNVVSSLKTLITTHRGAPMTNSYLPSRYSGNRRAPLVRAMQSSTAAAVVVRDKKTDKFVSVTYKLSIATSTALLIKTLYILYLHLSTFDTNEVTKTVVLSMLSKVAILISNIIVSFTVADAAERGRLNGGTFQILNFSIFLASIVGSIKPLFEFKAIFSSFIALFLWLDQLFRLKGSLKAFRTYKIYNYKSILSTFQTSNFLSKTLLAAGVANAFSGVVNCNKILIVDTAALGVNGLLLASYNLFSVLVYPAVLLALSNAAAAGTKRMASPTYRNLSIATLLLSGVEMFIIKESVSKSIVQKVVRIVLPIITALAATEVLRRGVEENVLRVRADSLVPRSG